MILTLNMMTFMRNLHHLHHRPCLHQHRHYPRQQYRQVLYLFYKIRLLEQLRTQKSMELQCHPQNLVIITTTLPHWTVLCQRIALLLELH